ncbi:hypothetical protein C8F04DRAFT_1194673 [Mycena alexandri]|uniref:Uncharacterized protein n=1 Tax=Mycena alexandri TaxID=1745969 RepID=A0AAD6SB46_9AGAR|nr:hypothetical protein C8F04DRAFT_1194673 [Mycena alexandri]
MASTVWTGPTRNLLSVLDARRLESARRRAHTGPLPPWPPPSGLGQQEICCQSLTRVDLNRRDVEHTRDLFHHGLHRLDWANKKSARVDLNRRDVEHTRDLFHHGLHRLDWANKKSARVDLNRRDVEHTRDLPHHGLHRLDWRRQNLKPKLVDLRRLWT